MSKSNSVELLGVEIPVKASRESELLDSSLERVEEQVDSIREGAPEASRIQVALLAAMNLAGRLVEREAEKTPPGFEDETLDRLDELHERVKQSEVNG